MFNPLDQHSAPSTAHQIEQASHQRQQRARTDLDAGPLFNPPQIDLIDWLNQNPPQEKK